MEYTGGKNCYFHDTGSSPSPSLKHKDKDDNQATMNMYVNKSYESDKDEEETQSGGCWYKYSQESTLHGLRFVTDFQANPARRFIWFLLILGCMAVLCYQMVDRILYFYSYPVSVKVEINFNESIVFPAVTICNQNSFKATAADKHGLFGVIEKLYGNTDKMEKLRSLQDNGAQDITMKELYIDLAHDKEDFIVGCNWGNRKCSHEDFETVLTDHGVCYTFDQAHYVASQGVEHGLRLTLNVEQYEYMPGKFDAAGIKLQLHNGSEFPLVHELGSAIPTGTHAFVGVKMHELHNLVHPYGECGSADLTLFDNYTTEVCTLENEMKKVMEVCQCRPAFIRNVTDGFPVCSLESHINCIGEFSNADFVEHTNFTSVELKCPVPCHVSLFEPAISYASVSNYAVDKLIGSDLNTNLLQKLTQAKETKYRREDKHFDVTKKLIENFDEKLKKVGAILGSLFYSSPLEVQRRIYDPMESVWRQRDDIFKLQEFVLKKDFMKAWVAMEERYMHILVTGFEEFALRVIAHLKLLLSRDDSDQRYLIYQNLVINLDTRMQIINRTTGNYTNIMKAFSSGKGIYRHKYGSLSKKHNSPATPMLLLSSALKQNKHAKTHMAKFTDSLNSMTASLLAFRELADAVYNKVIYKLSDETLFKLSKSYISSCREFITSRNGVHRDVIEWPLHQLIKKRENFTRVWKKYKEEFEDSEQNLKVLKSSFLQLNTLFLRQLDDVNRRANNYLRDDSMKLVPLSKAFLTDSVRAAAGNLKSFFHETNSRTDSLDSSSNKMKELTNHIWTQIINDDDARSYYVYTNNSYFLRNIAEISHQTSSEYSQYFRFSNFRSILAGSDTSLVNAFDDLMKYLKAFKASLKIDSKFFRDNFLNVDIFYRQLSYEEVEQQIAYNEFSLLCDIGGTMGLFIGASCLTIFEVLDLILLYCFRRKDDS